LIGVQGSLKIETWSDNKASNRSKPVIKVDRLDLLGSKQDTDHSAVNSYNDTEF
jgi:single-strand DNA-binding protein